MRGLIQTILAIAFCSDFGSAVFTNVYPKLKSYPVAEGEDVGDPLFLTPLIESGKIDVARKQATVQHKEMSDVGSYAGYLTVNKQYNSNLFFWFFPAQVIILSFLSLLFVIGYLLFLQFFSSRFLSFALCVLCINFGFI